MSHVAISQWERDETEPNGENLLRLARTLGATPYVIVKGKLETNSVGYSSPEDNNYDLVRVSPRKRILLELFDDLPECEADALLRSLEDKKTVLRRAIQRAEQKTP